MTTPVVDPTLVSGFSRRNFFRFAAGASALATMPILTEAHLALAQRPHFADPNKGIHIDANENPLGPSDAARQAMIDIVPKGGAT
jgi:histidinol-phosphate aminotransferase